MKAQLKILNTKFDALKLRERWMIFVAGFVVIYSIFNTLLLDPVIHQRNQLRTETEQSQSQIADMQQQLTVFARSPVLDVNTQNKNKIADLQMSTQENARKINELSSLLLKPEAMPELLKGLLQQNAGLSLVSMKTLAPKNILEKEKAPSVVSSQTSLNQLLDQTTIYQHGVEVTLSGRYLDLLRYAEALEHLKLQVLWNKAELKANDYPESQLTLNLYTLSLDKTWLSI